MAYVDDLAVKFAEALVRRYGTDISVKDICDESYNIAEALDREGIKRQQDRDARRGDSYG